MTLAGIFSDNAVLQRDKPIPIWGSAAPWKSIRVSLGSCHALCEADADGNWKITFPAMPAALGLTLTTSDGEHTLIRRDIAIGDVWLAGGQSNMEFPLKYDCEREQAYAGSPAPGLRYYCCPKLSYPGQELDEDHSHEGIWRQALQEELPYFSAIGFYFARALRESLGDVPVGIIDCTWGGTSASSWMTDDYLDGALSVYVQLREETRKLDLQREFTSYKESQAKRNTPEAKAWMNTMMATPLTQPLRFTPPQEEIERFLRTKYSPFSPFRAGGLYHMMLKPLIPCGLTGFIWYQGEEDTNHAELYTELFSNMIRCWRESWQERLPFIFAQLTAFEDPRGWNPLDFVPIRRAQELVARQMPDTYMVCTMDVGSRYDIHPKRKRPIGERMAAQALCHIYGHEGLSEAPAVRAAYKEPGRLVIQLSHCGEGLKPQTGIPAAEMFVNGRKVDFLASASGDTLIFLVPEIVCDSRVELRYAMQGYCDVDLFNSAGHPALPFRVEL